MKVVVVLFCFSLVIINLKLYILFYSLLPTKQCFQGCHFTWKPGI